MVYNIVDLTDSNRGTIKDAIDDLSVGGWTPLAEVLYEAGLYFKGAQSYFNHSGGVKINYTSPIEYYCQRNYIILMTDGISTQDRNSILGEAIKDRDGDLREPIGAANDPGFPDDGSDFLDDVTKYLYDSDLMTLENQQNIVTYTIGFELDSSDPTNAPKAKDLLQRAANHGHGKFYTTTGTVGLADAFMNILNEVQANTSSFVAPIVPVSRMERTTAGDKIYLAFFRPNQSGMWSGNIKKYNVAQVKDPSKSIEVGDVLDVYDSKALDLKGEFFPASKSHWTTSSNDGGEVEKGGVGEVLRSRDFSTKPRKIYTYTGQTDLTHSESAFTKTNDKIKKETLGVLSDTEKDKLIDFVHGIDVYDDNVNGSITDKRDWFLGSFLHSRPHIIHYADRSVIYAGANDGMLHAFNDSDGEELWAFIPQNFLSRLMELHTDTPGIFVDGSPKAYTSYDSNGNLTQAILIFGLRRGGNYYYALDVTNPLAPKYLWRIEKGSTFQDLGQTWSTPVIGKVAYGTGEKRVVIFGAGYDENQDLDNPANDTIGRGVYMADVLTGSLLWWKSYPGGTTTMTHCFPSDVTKLDIEGDGMIDRLYVGDAYARLWRFDIGDLNKNGSSDTSEWTAKIIFQSNTGASEKRKMFYPPDVTLEKDSLGNYEMLFFGTGNREDPKNVDTAKINRLYAVKDRNSSTILKEADLVDVTNFYDLSAAEQASTLNNIKTNYGWYIALTKKLGEKCLATPLVFYGTAYYTTFAPTFTAVVDPCFIGEGEARLYAVNYGTGEAVFNFDLTNDSGGTVIKGSDRALLIGSAIPSGVVITVIGGKVTAYVGVGGGVYRPQLSSTKSLFPLTWKLVF